MKSNYMFVITRHHKGIVDSIRDADDFINCCIDIDEMVGSYGQKGYRTN